MEDNYKLRTQVLSNKDTDKLDDLVSVILEDFNSGSLTKEEIVSGLGHIISAIDMNNRTEIDEWLSQGRKNMRTNKSRAPLSLTQKLISKFNESGITPPLIEQDDDLDSCQDNVFIKLRKKDYVSGFYLAIELENESNYSLSLCERGHSGGDPTLGINTFFNVLDEDDFIQKAVDIYNAAPTF
jgi:hypothetical protein